MATDVFDLYGKIKLDTSEYARNLDKADKGFSEFGKKIKAGLGAIAAASAAAVGAGAAAVGKIVSDSVQAYGSYEQLVGGVQTLFGDSAQTVLANSEKAFATAGMSMNDYMETSIQSAAALINSLEGDQAKAADLMDLSIIDMSDNVNKMGTTMEAVQNAYRGFSRGNFTMLDNLALGFAGTKEGMQELLDKAEQISGIKYDISSYSDIVQAIHVVQQEMGITGTTAKEAADTIQGSAGSMKAAWENLKVELVKEDGDIGRSIDIMVNSALTAFDNIEPKIERALNGMSQFIAEAAPVIAEKLPPIIKQIAPPLISSSAALVGTLSKSILATVPSLMDSGIGIMAQLNSALRSDGVDSSGFLQNIADDITSRIPTVFRFGRRIIETIADDLLKVDYEQLSKNLSSVVRSALGNLGKLVDNIDWNLVGEDISKFVNGLEWGKIITDLGEVIGGILKKTPEFLEGIIDNLDFENASLIIATIFTPKILGKLGNELNKDGAFDSIKNIFKDRIGEGAEPSAQNYFTKFTAGLEAFALGWNVGTFIRNLIGPEKINSAVEKVFEDARLLLTGTNNAMIEEMANAEAPRSLGGIAGQMVRDAYESTGHDARGRYASGGIIIKRPTYDRFGNLFGEAGKEAILPLESNTGWIDELADRLNQKNNGVVVQNLYLSVEGGRIADDYDTDRFIERVSEKLAALSVRQNRATGGTGW